MAGEVLSHRWDEYGMITAQILYHMPDHPSVLQTFIWQTFDLAPEFPELHRFLDFWQRELDGPLHSVTVAHKKLVRAGQFEPVTTQITLH
ncbi:usg protein [Bauldia litoralis]|uniref:Usg-like family protein n=1 Tax=Bauldia litoralis TaxID=665467 RepID=A0A1G6DJL0_9HYPH|nr:aspartate-semialdehyde dehydrogenase [Bauldia litoralis]SDB45306.1 Usg protein (tryptophan operon, function unknown) [Bauldia litoralis]